MGAARTLPSGHRRPPGPESALRAPPTPSPAEQRAAARADSPRVHPLALCSPLGRRLSLRGLLMETLEDPATLGGTPGLPALYGFVSLSRPPKGPGESWKLERGILPRHSQRSRLSSGGFLPSGPGPSRPRGARRETGAATAAREKTTPVTTAGEGDSRLWGEESRGLATAPVSDKRGGRHPFRGALGSGSLHSGLWARAEAAVAPRKHPPPRVEGRAERPAGRRGRGVQCPRGRRLGKILNF